MYSRRVSLPAIITLARAGSLELAERLFDQSGYAQRLDDPAALAVRGRLRKDRAARLPRAERRAAYALAAAAYAAADDLAPQPYTRLNVATLTYLAGDHRRACTLAQDLSDWLDNGADIADTPYYLEATRAEARLLCDDAAGAAAALERAIAAQPQAFEDHAATLRQFAAICAEGGIDAGFLDALRPPRSLHYAGHLGIAPDARDALARSVAAYLDEARVGFGFGALAAGAELVIAGALLDRGAELHVFLCGSVEEFAAISVDPYGAQWRTAFDRCLDEAAEVRCFAQPGGGYQPLGSRLAADVAMGAALMNAGQLESDAVQLLIADDGAGDYGDGSETARIGAAWRARGGATGGGRARGSDAGQRVLRAARTAPVIASGVKNEPEGFPDLRLAAMLRIELDGLDRLDEADVAIAVEHRVRPLRAGMAALPIQPDLMLPAGNARIAAFADPALAWHYARGVLALMPMLAAPPGSRPTSGSPDDATALPLKLAGHYGLTHWLTDPSTLVGRALVDLDHVASGGVPGVLTVSEPLARVLQLAPEGAPRVEHVGEVAGIELYSVTEDTYEVDTTFRSDMGDQTP